MVTSIQYQWPPGENPFEIQGKVSYNSRGKLVESTIFTSCHVYTCAHTQEETTGIRIAMCSFWLLISRDEARMGSLQLFLGCGQSHIIPYSDFSPAIWLLGVSCWRTKSYENECTSLGYSGNSSAPLGPIHPSEHHRKSSATQDFPWDRRLHRPGCYLGAPTATWERQTQPLCMWTTKGGILWV